MMMKVWAVVAGIASAISYEDFIERFGRNEYAHLYSREAFLENLRGIEQHSSRHYSLGVN